MLFLLWLVLIVKQSAELEMTLFFILLNFLVDQEKAYNLITYSNDGRTNLEHQHGNTFLETKPVEDGSSCLCISVSIRLEMSL